MSQAEMTAYINMLINASDKKAVNTPNIDVKRYVSTRRKPK